MKIGLSDEEVFKRIQNGEVNTNPDYTIKSNSKIISSNIFTLFNIINVILAIMVFITGQYRNALFIIVIIINTTIGIIQELRAKKTLDKLRLLSQPHAYTYRNDELIKLNGNDLVINDICKLKLGDQILSDGVIKDGKVTVNESLLTGESEHIEKRVNDQLYAGSFITSGSCLMEITRVGKDNYINKILKNAKREKRQPSRLKDALDFIIKSVSLIIVPIGILIFLKQYYISGIPLDESILQTVASLVGMIPEGLILLTSVSLTLGALKLSRENTLVQEMYSLETLARCNVLCLDKTGTITNGNLKVVDVLPYSNDDISNIIANMMRQIGDDNPTANALKAYFKYYSDMPASKIETFSSSNKKSAMECNGIRYEIGAYQFLDVKPQNNIEKTIQDQAELGNRVLALSKNKMVIALIIIQDEIRKNAKETLAYFSKQNVELKVISGDDPITVSNILKKVDFKNSDLLVDCSKANDEDLKQLVLDHYVFGRVNPDQKRLMIETLKSHGNTVGMVGDGVNDVMALKEADFSVAMFDGAESAKNIANVILMDNDFSHMHKIVDEGRRVINNIQRTSTLFLSKTVLSILLSLLTIFFFKEYPFSPIQLTLISALCIGFPSFVLSLEPDRSIVKGNFLANVLSRAIPSALAILASIVIIELAKNNELINPLFFQSIIVFVTFIILIYVLYDISKPLNILRLSLIIIAIFGMFIAYIVKKDFFYLLELDFKHTLIIIALSLLSIVLYIIFKRLNISSKLSEKIDKLY